MTEVSGGNVAKVFLSYDREDAAKARSVADALEVAGHHVWWDKNIRGGAQYTREIERALDGADSVVVLWSRASIESEWVRDEAAEGRDRGKLVPALLDRVKPPMGFRQFQTIDLVNWSGSNSHNALHELIDAVGESGSPIDNSGDAGSQAEKINPRTERRTRDFDTRHVLIACIVAAALGGGLAAWKYLDGAGLPVVEVAAGDNSAPSRDAANDLFVKLGTLAQVGQGKWQLLDSSSTKGQSDLIFRTSQSSVDGHPHGSLLLLDGGDKSLLWSREFGNRETKEATLKQQMALTAGRVLGCALESRQAKLKDDINRQFLNACATMAEVGWDKQAVIPALRNVVTANPKFAAGWSRLLGAEIDVLSLQQNMSATQDFAQFNADIAAAKKVDPTIPELTYAELEFGRVPPFAPAVQKIERVVAQHPDDARALTRESNMYALVGRSADAVVSAKRATEADPLSPEERSNYVLTLAYAGQVKQAWEELAQAKLDFPEAVTLNEAEMAMNLRYGDVEKSVNDPNQFQVAPLFFLMRKDPSPENIARFKAATPTRGLTTQQLFFALAAFTQVNRPDEAYALLESPSAPPFPASDSYLFFRSFMTPFRADPRFMPLMKKLGLVDYWRSSGQWPDFCTQPERPYDCQAEAAKLG